MSRAADTITLPLPAEAAIGACQMAIRAGNWKIMNTDGRNFLIKEQFGLVSMLFSYPTKAAILVRDESDGETRIELHASIFGFGPLQKGRVRAALARLRGEIEQAASTVAAEA
ncbi:MAG: hypothetical protein ACM3N5_07915 [Candidatus Eiseniibacteriota bacterium]